MKLKIQLFALGLLFLVPSFGQGDALFKAKCNTCHQIEKNSVGPMLKGVKAKWEEAGEGAMLHEWVKNPASLLASGKSKSATAVKDFSPTDMPPQQVTDEEIDQIFQYIDSYTPPAPAPTETTTAVGSTEGGTTENVQLVPDYKSNLTLFYALLILILIMLIGIILMSNAVLTFVRSDLFKNKMKEKNNSSVGMKIILALFTLGAFLNPSNSFALSYRNAEDPAQADMPWLKVETFDIVVLICVNVVLLLIIFYLRSLFHNFYYMVYPKKEKQKKSKVAKALTDAVPVEEESSILLEHEYDGIRELDNNLPPWWLYGFYLTIIFSVIYIFHYEIFQTGNSQKEEYEISMEKAKKEIDAYLKNSAMNIDESNVTLLTDATALETGKGFFEANCTACHKDGRGEIGPNLTDNFWLYGNDIKDVFKTIKNGTPKGMPEHGSKLNPVQLQQVASYVLSLKYIKGKEPEGKEYPKN